MCSARSGSSTPITVEALLVGPTCTLPAPSVRRRGPEGSRVPRQRAGWRRNALPRLMGAGLSPLPRSMASRIGEPGAAPIREANLAQHARTADCRLIRRPSASLRSVRSRGHQTHGDVYASALKEPFDGSAPRVGGRDSSFRPALWLSFRAMASSLPFCVDQTGLPLPHARDPYLAAHEIDLAPLSPRGQEGGACSGPGGSCTRACPRRARRTSMPGSAMVRNLADVAIEGT
jgi:hypothetical protein